MSDLHPISPKATYSNPHRLADILFLHGLGGHHLHTWKHHSSPDTEGDATNSFPHWLASDFPDTAVWSLAYAASPSKLLGLTNRFFAKTKNPDAGHAMPLPDRARQVLDLLILNDIGTARPLFFICHSLGGLLAKQILRTSADATPSTSPLHAVFTNTRAVLFLATPHTGAPLATLADNFRTIFATTINLTELQAHDAHLRDLDNWYRSHALAPNIETATYFESRSLKGFTIVNPSSANPGTGRAPIALDDDHLSIAKPANQNAQVYRAAAALLRDHVLLTPIRRKTTTQHPTADQPPFELPPPADQFFGRIPQLAELTTRLRARKNTTVVGAAGLGKTALSAQALRDIVGEDGPANLPNSPFPNGLIFVDLYTNATTTIQALWDILANKLAGPTFLERAQSRDRATAACQAAQSVLIVIEGGEEASGEDGRPTITEFLSVLSPQNRYLLLTRLKNQSLATDTIYLTDALHPDEAANLFDHITRGDVPAPLRTQALTLFEGHPLAITWAANLLAFKDDSPQHLIDDWTSQQLPPLSDPLKSEHTLHWLFNRSIRGINPTARRALDAAGLLARRPFPSAAITAPLGDDARQALKTLAQRSLLMLADQPDHWQFTHVLAYRFARREKESDPALRVDLARWLEPHLTAELQHALSPSTVDALEHLGALLQTDTDQSLWQPLVENAIYRFSYRLEDLGSLLQAGLLLDAVTRWLDLLPPTKASDSDWLRERGSTNDRQGNIFLAKGDLISALAAFQKSLDIAQKLADSDPTNTKWQRDLSVSENKIGDVLLAQGDLTSALFSFQNSLDIRQKLAAADFSDSTRQRDLSVGYTKIGDVLETQGDLTSALSALQKSLDIMQKLTAADPSNTRWQGDLFLSLGRIGGLLEAQGDLTSALSAFQKSLDITQQLVTSDPFNSQWQRGLSFSLYTLARIHDRLGTTEQAHEFAKMSLSIDESLAALDPTNATWQEDVKLSRALVARLAK